VPIVGKDFQKSIPDKFFNKDDNHFCSMSCSATFYNKLRIHSSEETKKKIADSVKKYYQEHPIGNSKKVKKICPICNKEFYVPQCGRNQIYCSKQCYLIDSEHKFRKQPKGGVRAGAGRGKFGWYKGYWCDSSWELAYVIYNLEHNIEFKRNTEGFDYEFNGKYYKYYPDFILNDGTYVEVKGFMTDHNKAKVDSFKKHLIILDETAIKPYLNYAIEKHGKNFIELFEGNPYKEKKNKCLICGKPAKNLYCSRECSGKASVLRRLNDKQ